MEQAGNITAYGSGYPEATINPNQPTVSPPPQQQEESEAIPFYQQSPVKVSISKEAYALSEDQQREAAAMEHAEAFSERKEAYQEQTPGNVKRSEEAVQNVESTAAFPSVKETEEKEQTEEKQEQASTEEKEKETKTEKNNNKKELSKEEKQEVQELKKRDAEVRAHEAAHVAAGGGNIRGGVNYASQTGPDGVKYAVGGDVSIDTSPVAGDPEATLKKAQSVRAAATAPSSPSSADMAVAAKASQMASNAMQEIAEERKQTGVSEEPEAVEAETEQVNAIRNRRSLESAYTAVVQEAAATVIGNT